MTSRPPVKPIMEALWPRGLPPSMKVWAIVDGARDRRIYGAVDGCYLEKTCLYSGALPSAMKMAAPYLLQLEYDDLFLRNLIHLGWGQSWGIFLRADTGMEKLRRHLRQFLVVRSDKGKRLIFRYYDPRVLRAYLPTCFPNELRTVYGPIQSYLTEAQDADALTEYRFENGKLEQKSFRLT